jgi:prolyl-tRNA editing enzyme YbaK/EbsC (Cys-tRNA(Pro) deacylase)
MSETSAIRILESKGIRYSTSEIDETAQLYKEIYVSPGVRGMQVKLLPVDLQKVINAKFADLV